MLSMRINIYVCVSFTDASRKYLYIQDKNLFAFWNLMYEISDGKRTSKKTYLKQKKMKKERNSLCKSSTGKKKKKIMKEL